MQKQTPTTKDEARQYAIDWQNSFDTHAYSWGELAEWSSEFEALGEKFDLTEEFETNGII